MVNTETWQQYKVGDLTTWKSGGTPSKNNDSYWNGNIPWISAKTFDKNEVCDSETKISEQGLRNGSRLADVDSVLLLVRGSGLFNRLPVGIVTKPVAFNQDIKAIEVRKEKITPRFFLYWLEGNKDLLYSKLELTGIGAGKFDIDILKGLPIHLPTLEEQNRIVLIIKNIDDKIELNRQTAQTLEAIAEAIFKEWFVDFNFPGATGEMQESELGGIPKGWRVEKLGQIIDFVVDNRGKTPPILKNDEAGIPLVEVNALVNCCVITKLDLAKKFVSNNTYQSWFRKGHPQRGDVLFSTVGSIAEISLVFDETICIAQNVIALRSLFSSYYVYFYLKNIKEQLKGLDVSSVQPSIKVPHLLDYHTIIPCKKML